MRRRRRQLQVSTFPFLAVLLGAMGSLIFLLLVMDRRAKLVARNKVREAHEARLAALSEADRTRQEDWERQRRALHESLAAEESSLRGRLDAVAGELQQSSRQLHGEAEQHRRLQALLAAEQARLTQAQEALRQRQAALLQSAHLAETSKAELARLTRDLLDLEQTLDSFKRWKQQQRPTYSLVPYHGQRGADRMPIYVECTSAGLMFLPDGARLTGGDADIGPFRAEVEKRHGPLVKAKKRTDPFAPDPAAERPYVLFLVRPNGIGSFYRGQAALRGFAIDYGYELVDADWTLHAPADPAAALASLEAPAGRSGVSHPQKTFASSGAGNSTGGKPGGPGLGGGTVLQAPARPDSVAGRTGQERNPVLRFEAAPKPSADPPLSFRPAQTKGPAPGRLDQAPPALKVPGQATKNDGSASDDASAKQQAAPSAAASPLESKEAPAQERNALSRLAPPLLAADKKAPARPAALGRVIGNRDFVITIACYLEGAIVTPGGRTFVWKAKAEAAKTDETLVRAVSQLVASRQATVRTGEPPYRPVLRFLVHEQGRRTYYRVYPLLERLRLPMVREDVEE
ncbi:MAG: hypothetical protein L0Y71_04720 [Gemmataceae bacterium]|nr:hypothetical protein [Gemmataceae bacterium]